jgi:DNA-binding NarL/FixJ family response regulator
MLHFILTLRILSIRTGYLSHLRLFYAWISLPLIFAGLGLTRMGIPVYGQSKSFQALSDSVYRFNNALKFNKSQALLLPVLQSSEFTADEKYQAALLLSYTYKRVQDYQSTLLLLEKARNFARQTPAKEKYIANITAQEAFAHFDIHNYEKSDSLIRLLETTNFRHIDLENKAKLVMQQGYLLYLGRELSRAETTYDRAIGWLREASPCDLPMIYVKKMQLYDAMHEPARMLDAFRNSRHYADSCGIIKYDIYAHTELLDIYKSHNDPAGLTVSRRLDSLNKVYDQIANVSALHNQKETMLLAEGNHKLQREQHRRLYLTLGLVVAGLLALALLAWGLLHYRKKQTLENELRQIQRELEAYLAQRKQATWRAGAPAAQPGHAPPDSYNPSLEELSDRQREILDLLAAGMSNREIADRIFVSENTIKYHIRKIYQILNIKDRKDLLVNFRK